MVAQNIAYGVITAFIVVAALRMVTTRNVVHAALYLVVVLAGIAAEFLLLAAEFLAATQVLVYIGAVVILFLFGIMLTRARLGKQDDLSLPATDRVVAFIAALAILGTTGYAVLDTFRDTELPDEPVLGATEPVADAIFGPYLVPFEVVSLLLLAALIAAIVIARRD